MNTFAPIGQQDLSDSGSFWPSFTDIMMVVVLIFLFATSILIVRNYQLVAELHDSLAAEKVAEEKIESTTLQNATLEQRLNNVENEIASATQENATLEERLTNYEQENSLLRLQVLAKQEKLKRASLKAKKQHAALAELKKQNQTLLASVQDQSRQLQQNKNAIKNLKVNVSQLKSSNSRYKDDIASLQNQLSSQTFENTELNESNTNLQSKNATLQKQISTLQQTIDGNELQISLLNEENAQDKQAITLLKEERASYNEEILTLKGDYEVVKAKYDKLIKPARSAKGKYIAEVHYIKSKNKDQISYKEPADTDYTVLKLNQVEAKLDKLKAKYGKELYVKIIIPKNSGLTYSEAWTFMKNLLDKYDYYYQQKKEDQ